MQTDGPTRRAHDDANRQLVALLREGLAVTVPNDAALERAATTLLGLQASPVDAAIAAGIPASAVQALAGHLQLNRRHLLSLLGTTAPALRHQPLGGRVSQALTDLALVTVAAQAFFSAPTRARDWLRTPRETLKGASPLAFAMTPGGAAYIVVLLRRVEYGTYS